MNDCDRLLAVLKDGGFHSHSELYGLGMIVHSRIADLRARGLNIVCRRQSDWNATKRRRETTYFYALIAPALDSETNAPTLAVPRGVSESSAASGPDSPPPVSPAEPTLEEYGIHRAVAELNAAFPGMLVPARDAMLSLAENRQRLEQLKADLFGEAA